jgi:cob(I)alamin adenosyltransferase
MSIATKRGDGGQTGLAGGIRVSKTHPRGRLAEARQGVNSALRTEEKAGPRWSRAL